MSTFEELQAEDALYDWAAAPEGKLTGVCYAARASGLYRSEDGGTTWVSCYDTLELEEPLPTTAVVLSPDFERDYTLFAGAKGAILRSSDGGQSWTAVVLPEPPPLISALVVSPHFAEDGVVLAATVEDGTFCSTDRGEHWTAWNFGLLDLHGLCMAISPNFAEDETVFVGTETGIFRSTNGGRAWREVGFPTELAPVIQILISPDYAQDGALVAETESAGAYCSVDGGDTWETLDDSDTSEVASLRKSRAAQHEWFLRSLAAHPQDD